VSHTKTLKTTDLHAFLQAASRDRRLVAPTRDGDLIAFNPVDDPANIVPHTDYVNPRTSIKEFFFPKSEPVLDFDRTGDSLDLADADTHFPPTILYGCRPCDAASLPIMDALYNWDYADEFWNQRRLATTVIAVACTRADESCFCTALGGAPNGTAGADILLTPVSDGEFLVEILTEKGQALAQETDDLLADRPDADLDAEKQAASADALDTLPPKLDLNGITEWLKAHFENDHWAPWSYKCWGCGCCTFLCPTCHCFDMVDQGGYKHGQRRKNWDACQFALFTLHASGHNPRPDQASRWRQRIEHKFNYYVQKFHYRSCVGCGRCIRHCPVNMNIHDQLTAIADMAGAEQD
jgi:hypothetical protein